MRANKLRNNFKGTTLHKWVIAILILLLSLSAAVTTAIDKKAFSRIIDIRAIVLRIYFATGINISELQMVIIELALWICTSYLLFIGIHVLIRKFLKTRINKELQFRMMQTNWGCYMHRHRLGYIINLDFWEDIIWFIFFLIVYVKCNVVSLESPFLNKTANSIFVRRGIMIYSIGFFIAFYFYLITGPLNMHSLKFLNKCDSILILHELKQPVSTFCMPPRVRSKKEYILLDECEYEYLNEQGACAQISLVFVFIDSDSNGERLNYLIEKYKHHYSFPHITSVLCVNMKNIRNSNAINIQKKYFDYYLESDIDISSGLRDDIYEEIESVLLLKKKKEVKAVIDSLPLQIMKYYNQLYTAPLSVYSFYRKILNIYELKQAVNSLFDIIDFSLRISVLACADFIEDAGKNIIIDSMGNLRKMRELLLRYSCIDFVESMYIRSWVREMEKRIDEKIYGEIPEVINFNTLLILIEHLRNNTKGHGFIEDDNLSTMFQVMFCFSIYVFFKLDICSVSIYVNQESGDACLEYRGRVVESFAKYVFFESEHELYIATNKRGNYINMGTGKMKNRYQEDI